MRAQAICAIAVVLAFAPQARSQQQTEPPLDLAPLVPPKAPWLRKNQAPAKKKATSKDAQAKKAAPKKGKKPPPAQAAQVKEAPALPLPEAKPMVANPPAPKPAEPELPLPPLVPMQIAPLVVTSVGVAVQAGGLDEARLDEGLRGVVKSAPMTRPSAPVAKPSCADDACFFALGAAQKLDQLLVATASGGAVRVRLLDVARKTTLADEQQKVEPQDALAAAEALACRILVPAGCTGAAQIDAPPGTALELDGKPIADAGRLPVGVHQLTARAGGREAHRSLAVTREGPQAVKVWISAGQPSFTAPQVPQAAIVAAPAPRRNWTRPVGITVLALGGAAALTGAIFGAKSHSDLNTAESNFRSNGGAYRAGDLTTLSSGNSAAHTANALFVASGLLLAAGAVVTFAF
jgi:hypothetical protein